MYNGVVVNENASKSPSSSAVNCGDFQQDDNNGTIMFGEASSPKSGGSSKEPSNLGSRDNLISSHPTIDLDDSLTEIVIDDFADIEPTSAILHFCKEKFLRPYVNLLGFVGLFPMMSDVTCLRNIISHLQTITMIIFVVTGYLQQYHSTFRRDRGFYTSTSTAYIFTYEDTYKRDVYDFGEILFVYIMPSVLHFLGFLTAIYEIRIADNEQLQNLVERVFLLTNSPKRLCITLWLFVFGGLFYLCLLLTQVIFTVTPSPHLIEIGRYGKFSSNFYFSKKALLIFTVFTHDALQVTVLTTYCIQCYLLKLHLNNLKEKLIQHTIETIDWMREVLEFRKLLNHLNRGIATPICFFTVMNLTYAFAGLVYLFQEYEWNSALQTLTLNIANFLLWFIIGLMPLFFAASVTRTCKSTQASGHQICIRPFVYHNTPQQDLDSTLLFVSSLDMSAKLFRMPIQGNYLCCSIVVVSIVILTLGMCLNFSLGSI